MANNRTKEAETFAKYLVGKKILIADGGAAARSSLFRVFVDLGAKTSQIILANSFKAAKESLEQAKPHLVVAEYELGKRSGLDLLQTQREQNPDAAKEMIFCVVTGNTSQTAVAKAAEEDIDAFILKPYTMETVRQIIMKAALQKIKPTEYRQLIDQGKELLINSKVDEAEAVFKKAIPLDPAPSLAYFYLGQAKLLRKVMEQAEGSYLKGLEFNKIHYKCMIGLYELMMSAKKHAEAYEVVKRISQYFPANPKRLSEVLRLAIINAKYEDVEKYYAAFISLDERDENLIKYICAALVVCGKHYIAGNAKSRALELFTKAAATGAGRTKILKEIFLALMQAGMHKEAKTFLDRFPPEAQSSEDYLLLHFQLLNTSGNKGLIIDRGKDLIQKGLVDETLFTIMIQRYLEANLKPAAETLLYKAIEAFPKRKTEFEGLLKGI